MTRQRLTISMKIASIIMATLLLSACNTAQGNTTSQTAVPTINQSDLCIVKRLDRDIVASQCEAGEKVVYLPNRWGNPQLPIKFTAMNCDLRYTVALTEGAVTCIYRPLYESPKLSVKPSSLDSANGSIRVPKDKNVIRYIHQISVEIWNELGQAVERDTSEFNCTANITLNQAGRITSWSIGPTCADATVEYGTVFDVMTEVAQTENFGRPPKLSIGGRLSSATIEISVTR